MKTEKSSVKEILKAALKLMNLGTKLLVSIKKFIDAAGVLLKWLSQFWPST